MRKVNCTKIGIFILFVLYLMFFLRTSHAQTQELEINQNHTEFIESISYSAEEFIYYLDAPSGSLKVELTFRFFVTIETTLTVAYDLGFYQVIDSIHEPNGGDIIIDFSQEEAHRIYISVLLDSSSSPSGTIYYDILVSSYSIINLVLFIVFLVMALIISIIIIVFLRKSSKEDKNVVKTASEIKSSGNLTHSIQVAFEREDNKQLEKEAIEKIKRIVNVSNKVKLEMIYDILNLERKTFYNKILEWAETFNFTIDGDYLIIKQDDLESLLGQLDNLYKDWNNKEVNGK